MTKGKSPTAAAEAPTPMPAQAARPFAAVLVAGTLAWWGTWRCEYKFDDLPLIADNDNLHSGGFWQGLANLPGHTLGNRPLTWMSLRFDLAVFGDGPFGPHLANMLLHLANACLLFVLVRDTLLAPNLGRRFTAASAMRAALAVAVLWVVHPLATEAVAYAAQRSTLLASTFVLLALFATRRAVEQGASRMWQAVVPVALAAAMTTKEDSAVGPLLVILYERAFLLPDWRASVGRWRRYALLLSTWLVVAACMAMGPESRTVGQNLGLGVGAYEWLLTQAGVVAHYARLSLWPSPLRGAYDWGIVRNIGDAALPGMVVLMLLCVTIWCWRTRPAWGFVGSVFFLCLAPTSTVVPIITEVIAERRAYLPMLTFVVAAVFGGRAILQRVAPGAGRLGATSTIAAAVALALLTRSNLAHYETAAAFWSDAYEKRDPQSRTMLAAQILGNYGASLHRAGKQQEANALFDLAMQCESPTHVERTLWASSLHDRGRVAEAVAALEQAIREQPDYAEAHGTLGTCLLMEFDKSPGGKDDARLTRAATELQRAVALEPRRLAYWNGLASAHWRQGHLAEAETAFRRAIALPYDRPEPFLNLAMLLEAGNRSAEAQQVLDSLVATHGDDGRVRFAMVRRCLQRGDRAAAVVHLRELVRLEPDNTQAAQALREMQSGR